MTEPEDIDALAAEYVLGTLDAVERMAVAQRRVGEAALSRAIEAWEGRLGPLAAAVPSVAPPPDLFARIEARIRSAQSMSPGATRVVPDLALRDSATNVVVLEQRIKRWRRTALAASAIAASLALVIGVRETLRPPLPANFVAVLQKDAASPAFLMTVDIETRQLTIRAVAPDRQQGKSFELWLVNPQVGGGAPRSLGLLQDAGFSPTTALQGYDRGIIEGATYAVSLEPQGGSTTGAPTGPVLYAGKLVQTTR